MAKNDIKHCKAILESFTPYSQSRAHETPKLEKETADAHDQRTWKNHLRLNKDGVVIIKGMSLKQCVDRVVKMLGMQIPGRGKNTYTKHFLSGFIVNSDIVIQHDGKPITPDDVWGERLHCNADGIRGSAKRVWRTFPIIDHWIGEADITIFDAQITKDVFEHHLHESGKYVGLGRFRPEVGGTNGRFAVRSIKWL
jgi:hypothetical protein